MVTAPLRPRSARPPLPRGEARDAHTKSNDTRTGTADHTAVPVNCFMMPALSGAVFCLHQKMLNIRAFGACHNLLINYYGFNRIVINEAASMVVYLII